MSVKKSRKKQFRYPTPATGKSLLNSFSYIFNYVGGNRVLAYDVVKTIKHY